MMRGSNSGFSFAKPLGMMAMLPEGNKMANGETPMHPILQKLSEALAAANKASTELDATLRTKGANPATLKSSRASGFSARRQLEALQNLIPTFETILNRQEEPKTEATKASKK